jgi:hypothetical protein
MGWTSSGDMLSQVQLEFDTKEEAVAYAEKHEIPYQVFEPHGLKPRRNPIPTISNSTARFPGRTDFDGIRAGICAASARRCGVAGNPPPILRSTP